MSDDPYIPPFETFELNAIPGQGFYLQPPVISSRAAAVPSSSNTPVAHALAKTTKSPMALEFNVTEEDDQGKSEYIHRYLDLFFYLFKSIVDNDVFSIIK